MSSAGPVPARLHERRPAAFGRHPGSAGRFARRGRSRLQEVRRANRFRLPHRSGCGRRRIPRWRRVLRRAGPFQMGSAGRLRAIAPREMPGWHVQHACQPAGQDDFVLAAAARRAGAGGGPRSASLPPDLSGILERSAQDSDGRDLGLCPALRVFRCEDLARGLGSVPDAARTGAQHRVHARSAHQRIRRLSSCA